jgi:hypothetical protein
MNERGSAMPVAVINPWTMARRMVMVADHRESASLVSNGWEILRDVKMHIDKDGIVQVDER